MLVLWYLYAFLYILLGLFMCVLSRRALQFAYSKTPIHSDFPFPKVSLIKPVKGVNAFTRLNFRSWLEQKYPAEIEYIFSFQDPEDLAIPIVRQFMDEFPSLSIKLIVNPIRGGHSGKTSNLYFGVEVATHEFLVFSDADTLASPLAVREMVLRAEKEKTVVSCMVLHYSAEGLFAHMYTTLWNAVIVGLWGPTMRTTNPPGLAGGTVAFFRCDLDRIGGVESFACYVAEDIKKGQLFKAAGYSFAIGPVIESQVGKLSKLQMWNAFMRGDYVSWNNESGGLMKAIPLYLFAYAYVLLLPWAVLVGSKAAVPLFLIYVSRVLAHTWFNWLAKNNFNFAFHTYINDVLVLITFAYSFYKRELEWAGVQYRITGSGRLEKLH